MSEGLSGHFPASAPTRAGYIVAASGMNAAVLFLIVFIFRRIVA